MNMRDYQREAARTADPTRNFRDQLSNAAMGLAGESGEFADMVKKHLHHGHDLDRSALLKELGDILWYVAEACTVLDADLSGVAAGNLWKLRARYPDGFSEERSRNREA